MNPWTFILEQNYYLSEKADRSHAHYRIMWQISQFIYAIVKTTMVNILLTINGTQIVLLSIPIDDIQRLTLRPLKWLRFVTFAVCGACGDLSETPNGPVVNYDMTSFALAPNYYYVPYGEFHSP